MKTIFTRKFVFAGLIILLAVITLLCTVYLSIRLYVNQFIEDNYQRRVAVWQETAAAIPRGSIVFIGDSHTEYFMLDEYFPGLPVINRGIFGDTTYGVIKRLEKSIFNLKPAKVFLLIGANDINKTNDTNETIVSNIKEIVRQIQNVFSETKIYVQSLYPVNSTGENSNRIDIFKLNNERISAINQLLESFCHNENIVYIDMFSQLIDEYGQLEENFTIEGLHLSPMGYRHAAEILRFYIMEEL